MMRKSIFVLLLFLVCLTVEAQKVKMGVFSPEDIAFTQVPFEPDAPAVVLWEEGDSRFFNGLLETSYLFRKKILTESGKEEADVRIRYYSGDKRVEDINGIKAQITSFNDGQPTTVKVGKESIFEVDLGKGYKEVRISFPNAQVGSILEYAYKKTDRNITFLDGWTFQNHIPTMVSQYQITMIPEIEYKMIGQGQKYFTSSEKFQNDGVFRWTIRDLYSLKEEPFMKNYRDYVERVEFQLSRIYTKNSSGFPDWKDFMTTWEILGDEILSDYSQKGYFRSNPIGKELVELDMDGDTQKEKAKKAYYYVRNNFSLQSESGFWPQQTLSQVLKTKTGTPEELNLTLMGMLKSMGISCEPILIGSKGNGRSSIVPFPFLNQFDEILLVATLDGEPTYLDLSDPLAPFGYVDLEKHVKEGLQLEKGKSKLIPIEIKHNSNTIFFSEITLDSANNLVMSNSLRTYHYEGLSLVKRTKNLERRDEALENLFKKTDNVEIRNVEVVDDLQDKNYTSTNFQLVLPNAGEDDLLVFNPLKFSNFSSNPFTQDYRIFPVDFGYAFYELYNATIKIPEGYEVDDYPLEERITIEGNVVSFLYSPKILGNLLQISARLEVKVPIIEAEQYVDLKFFMENVASKLSEPVVLKKVVQL